MNEYGKKMIASGIPMGVVQGAYDFVKEAFGNTLDALVGSDRKSWEAVFNLAMAAYVEGARRMVEVGTKEERNP